MLSGRCQPSASTVVRLRHICVPCKACFTKTSLVRWFSTEKREMNERKSKLKICFKLDKTPKETYVMLVRVYEDQTLAMRYVRVVHPLSKSKKSVSDNSRNGRLVISVSDENIEKMRKLITKDCQLTVRMIVDELQINHESVQQIVNLNLGMRKMCYRY
ncbi:uncharacterized protein TNCV_5017081 [Trichonephila clavipes]|nr:uncharacterized protein TNCV_5017081 [Trichonephila clavipes]